MMVSDKYIPPEIICLFISLLFLSFLTTFFEGYNSIRDSLFNVLSTYFKTIDGDNYKSSEENDYIYYYTHNMKYPSIKEPLFGFSHQCNVLERYVQYCQWVEVIQTEKEIDRKTNETRNVRYYSYNKKWLHNQISSSDFKNPIYKNPIVTEVPEISFRSKNMKSGAYKISESMTLHGSMTQFTPNDSQILEFEEEKNLSDFNYLGKGIFYSSYKLGILGKLLLIMQIIDMRGCFIDWCTPGDRRVWFESWGPSESTVVGVRINDTIKSFNYKDYKIGSVYPGKIGLHEAIKLNISKIPTLIKWMCRISIIVYLCCSKVYNKFDVLGTIYLVVCALLGRFLPSNFLENIILSLICLFVILFIKLFEINANEYKGKYLLLNIKASKKYDVDWITHNYEGDNSINIYINHKSNNYYENHIKNNEVVMVDSGVNRVREDGNGI